MIKKIVNLRTVFYIFILGLFCVHMGFLMNKSLYYSFMLIVPIAFLYLLFFREKYKFFAFATCFFIFLSAYSFVFIKNYQDDTFSTLDNMVVVGKIETLKKMSQKQAYITLNDAKITQESGKITKLRGKISITLSGENEHLEFGLYDIISFTASRISGISALKDDGSLNSYYITKNIKYRIKLTPAEVVNLGASPSLVERFREYNRQLLISRFGEKMGNLALTTLYADQNFIEQEIVQQFRESGVAHIFAVSGLHISILALVINFVLEKLRVNKKVGLIITVTFLFFYCALCSFNSPVVRASIMTTVALLCKLYLKKYDVLNAISLAGCIILLISPIYALDVGFQMTFFAVFGILMFSNMFKFIKPRTSIGEKIKSSFVTSFSAQLGLLPIFMNYFGSISPWTIPINMIIIPLFTVFYIILFITNIFTLILPVLSFLYYVPKAFLYVIVFLNKTSIGLPFMFISLPVLGDFLTYVYYLNMFLVSKYVVLKAPAKQITSYYLVSFIVLGLLAFYYPRRVDENKIEFLPETTIDALAMVNKSQFYLINPNLDNPETLYDSLILYRINRLKYIIVLEPPNELSTETLVNYFAPFSPIFILPSYYQGLISFEGSGINYIFANDNERLSIDNNLTLKYYYYENKPQAMALNHSDQKYGFINGTVSTGHAFDEFVNEKFSSQFEVARIYNQYLSSEAYWKSRISSHNGFVFDDSTGKISLVFN